jgi:hypothetical protein
LVLVHYLGQNLEEDLSGSMAAVYNLAPNSAHLIEIAHYLFLDFELVRYYASRRFCSFWISSSCYDPDDAVAGPLDYTYRYLIGGLLRYHRKYYAKFLLSRSFHFACLPFQQYEED